MKKIVLEKSLLIVLSVILFISCSKNQNKSETFTSEVPETATEMTSVENSEDDFEQQAEKPEKEEKQPKIDIVSEEEYLASYADADSSTAKPKMVFVEGRALNPSVGSFEIGMTEVTFGQYYPSIGKEIKESRKNYAAANVNWYEAVIYCNKLSIQYGYEPCYSMNGETDPSLWGNEVPYFTEAEGSVGDVTAWNAIQCNFNADGYRLPTDAEWAFAARGGNKSKGYKYSGSNNLDEVGWYEDNAIKDGREVAKKKPNELGIYDMSGNVWEWCWDKSGKTGVNTIVSAVESLHRIIRGGGYGSSEYYCTLSYTENDYPDVKSWYYGFRLCRSIRKHAEAKAENGSENSFTHCYFNSNTDQIILSNETGNYKLTVWLYGTPIEEGEYQVFGSDKETLLEGFLEEGNDSRDVKTTLFISYSEGVIKVSGSAQLYKPHSATKSGEILDFNYEGSLVKLME